MLKFVKIWKSWLKRQGFKEIFADIKPGGVKQTVLQKT
jgi:hypothetical protein